MKQVLCSYCLLLLLVLTPHPVNAETLIEFQQRLFENVKDVTDKARQGDSEIEGFVREKYDPKSGQEFNKAGGYYDDHPLRGGSGSDWKEAWFIEDSNAIDKHFGECFDIEIIGNCDICTLIEFWWPEAAFETNDYCQGVMMDKTSPMVWGPFWSIPFGADPAIAAQLSAAGCFIGDAWVKLKDKLIHDGPLTAQMKEDSGRKANLPKSLRRDPYWGRSRDISESGQFYEAHAYRTAWDFIAAGGKTSDPGYDAYVKALIKKNLPGFDEQCIMECFPTPVERFPVHATEEPLEHVMYWRFPEISVFLPAYHHEKWSDLFAKLPMIALSVGLSHYATSMSPMFPRTAAPMMGDALLKAATCSSYRSVSDFHSSSGRSPTVEATGFRMLPGTENEDYQRLCFPTSVGQLFPVTGYIPVVSHKTGPIGAGRRLWEIGSADRWSKFYRFNYYNDYNMENLYRTPSGDTKAGRRKADKWQRSYPEVSECFRTKDVDTLNNKLFPQEMEKTSLLDDRKRGEDRYIHWNRRRCCICPMTCPWVEE